jgi:site-specific recombinase XerD
LNELRALLGTREAPGRFLRSRRGRSPKTIAFYAWELARFFTFLETQGVTTPAGVTRGAIQDYLYSEAARGLRGGSVHAAARAIRAFMNWLAEDQELIAGNPMRQRDMPDGRPEQQPVMTPADVQAVYHACETTRDRALVLLLLDSGARAAEVCCLDVGDVDSERQALRIRRGKGGRGRVAGVSPATLAALAEYQAERGPLPGNAPLLASIHETRLTPDGLGKILRRLGERAGVAHCSPHTWRRTFCVMLVRDGANLFNVQALMGHSSLEMTRRYARLDDSDALRAHREHSPVAAMVGY